MTTPNPPAQSSGGGNVFTRKLGPLPMWGWMGIALALALVYYFYSKNKSANSQAQSSATNNTPGGVDSSLVPQFVNQTYVDNTPPAAPNVTVNNTIPPTPPPGQPPPTITPPNPKPPPTRQPAAPTEPIFNGSYTVKKGQTLAEVAKQFGITREQLAHANGLGTGAGLRTGQVLKVPNPAPGGKPNPAQ
jgi:LysM repeat protein